MLQCKDEFCTTFSSYPMMKDYHEEQAKKSQWMRCHVNELQIKPLDKDSPFYSSPLSFAPGTTNEAIEDCQCQSKNVGKRRRNFACF